MNEKDEQGVLEQFTFEMKRDWDWRARENAKWFINIHKFEQSEDEFDETGRLHFERFVVDELDLLTDGRDPGQLRVLEIGCGIGRMTRHFAKVFGEVHGVDVSGEMVRKAIERLGHHPNLFFYETSGIDFSAFPDEHFDLVFSAYVFQHVPSAEIVSASVRDAFRCLKPRGILNFQTNGITSAEFARTPKDTWTGTSFSEAEVRTLATELGGQLVGISGGGTQYCWSIFRKPALVSQPGWLDSPEIVACGGADDSSAGMLQILDGGVILTLIVTGADREGIDAGSLTIEFRDQIIRPHYVGLVRSRMMSCVPENCLSSAVQVDVLIHYEEPTDDSKLRVRIGRNAVSEFVTIKLPAPRKIRPRIQHVTNTLDGGLDIHVRGPKSFIRLFVFDLGESEDESDVRILVNNRELIPTSIAFLPGNGVWEIKTQLPHDVPSGPLALVVRQGNLESPPCIIEPCAE